MYNCGYTCIYIYIFTSWVKPNFFGQQQIIVSAAKEQQNTSLKQPWSASCLAPDGLTAGMVVPSPKNTTGESKNGNRWSLF